MENGRITDLKLLDASHETPAFLRRAKRLLTTVLTEQTWEVDAVSEATYTSRGILGAIRNALTGEVVNNPLPPQAETPAPESAPVEEPFTPPSAYRDGVYTASAEGFGGPITVQVTLAGGYHHRHHGAGPRRGDFLLLLQGPKRHRFHSGAGHP